MLFWEKKFLFNPFKPKGIFNYQLGQSICFKGCKVVLFIFIKLLIEHYVSKQWRSWSEATFWSVWSESALFAFVPQKGR